ncbi:MAG: hypothetical protein ACRDNS_18835 [Trebonia sp.]
MGTEAGERVSAGVSLPEHLLERQDELGRLRSAIAAAAAGAAGRELPPPARSVAVRGEASFGLVHGLYWLSANLAEQGPTLIAIDDAHSADLPTLRFLAPTSRTRAWCDRGTGASA